MPSTDIIPVTSSTNQLNTINEKLGNGSLKYETLRMSFVSLYSNINEFNLSKMLQLYLNSALIGSTYTFDGTYFKKNGSRSTNPKYYYAEIYIILNTTFVTQCADVIAADLLFLSNNTDLPIENRVNAKNMYDMLQDTKKKYLTYDNSVLVINILQLLLMENSLL